MRENHSSAKRRVMLGEKGDNIWDGLDGPRNSGRYTGIGKKKKVSEAAQGGEFNAGNPGRYTGMGIEVAG